MSRRDDEDWFRNLDEFRRMSEEMIRSRPKVAAGHSWEPRVDVFEEEHRILVKVEIAGVRGEDIQLAYNAERHSLVVRGVRDELEFADGSSTATHQIEIFYGPFQREIALPNVPIDASKTSAQYRNGFLVILVPKVAKTIVVTHLIRVWEV